MGLGFCPQRDALILGGFALIEHQDNVSREEEELDETLEDIRLSLTEGEKATSQRDGKQCHVRGRKSQKDRFPKNKANG
jgi:hypothetical protein